MGFPLHTPHRLDFMQKPIKPEKKLKGLIRSILESPSSCGACRSPTQAIGFNFSPTSLVQRIVADLVRI